MTTASSPVPIYEIRVTAIGPLVEEFTAEGVWVFFHDGAPEELAEFSLLHQAQAPQEPIAAGQVLTIDGQRYAITAVGDVANKNIRELGHIVLKANGLTKTQLPGEVCIEARPLPQPAIGTTLRVWREGSEVHDESL
jgi:PTS system glucitol/sorbitol-specific IIA component